MREHLKNPMLYIVSALAVSASFIAYQFVPKGPPAVVDLYEIITPTVRPGGALKLRSRVRHLRRCEDLRVERWAVHTTSGNAHVFMPLQASSGEDMLGSFSPALTPGETTYQVTIPAPPGLEPGPYRYRVEATFICRDGIYPVATPWLPFTVAAPGEGVGPEDDVPGPDRIEVAPAPPAAPQR